MSDWRFQDEVAAIALSHLTLLFSPQPQISEIIYLPQNINLDLTLGRHRRRGDSGTGGREVV